MMASPLWTANDSSRRAKVLKQKDPVQGTGSFMLSDVAGHRTLLCRTDFRGLFQASA